LTERHEVSRREFLFAGIGGTLFGWWPWHHPKNVDLAGAHFRIIRNKHSMRRYLLIHGNEETARQVLTRHMETHLGTAFIIESHMREVMIDSGKIDPNRMFSRVGAEASLRSLNPTWSDAQINHALGLLDKGREHLLKALFPPKRGLLIALHNNQDYSVNDELQLSEQVSLRQPDQPHAFFLCTSPEDYRILAGSPYNVVLQQHPRPPDDGSLSRRAAALNIRYLNLEVKLGDAARQQEMLDWAEQHLANS
jgi:hypothetical protein